MTKHKNLSSDKGIHIDNICRYSRSLKLSEKVCLGSMVQILINYHLSSTIYRYLPSMHIQISKAYVNNRSLKIGSTFYYCMLQLAWSLSYYIIIIWYNDCTKQQPIFMVNLLTLQKLMPNLIILCYINGPINTNILKQK